MAARRFGRLELLGIELAAYAASVGLVVLRRTVRTVLVGAADVQRRVRRGERVIVTFWHDQLLGMAIGYVGGPLRLLISQHRDGEIAARCLRRFGMEAVRGSSSRGGVGGVRRLLAVLRAGAPIVVVPDGPRGPRHAAKAGVEQLARAGGAEIVPVGFHASRGWRVRSWDRLLVPFPFSRVVLVQGRSLSVAGDATPVAVESARAELERELLRVTEMARGHAAAVGAGVDASELGAGPPQRPRRADGRVGRTFRAVYAALGIGLVLGARVASRWRAGSRWQVRERLGTEADAVRRRLGSRPAIWLHGASVGEVQALRALLPALRARLPGHAILTSALTRTGVELAAQIPGVDATMYFPLDARPVVRLVLDAIRPRLFAFTETEIWPALLSECANRGVPCVMLSGRVSAGAARRYVWVRPLLRQALASVTACVQSGADARRLRALGVDSARVHVAGSLKAEVPVDGDLLAYVVKAWQRVGVCTRVLLVGASTHPGEEEALLAAFEAIRQRAPELRLLLAPRHPERFDAVARLLDGRAGPWIRFSAIETQPTRWGDERVVLLDRIGVLRPCFRLARAAFVGGTLAPVGGHNVLEPAAEGCAVIFGPHVEHVGDAAQALLAGGGAVQVADAAGLVRAVEQLLADAATAAACGARAHAVVDARRGAVARHLEVLIAALGSETPEPPRGESA